MSRHRRGPAPWLDAAFHQPEGSLYKRPEATIVNRRQIFAVAPYECWLLSERPQVEVTPELLGENLLIGREDGTDYFISEVPASTCFVVAPAGVDEPPQPLLATLIQYVQKKGWSRVGRAIATEYSDKELTGKFVEHSEHQRGILCSVEFPVDAPICLERGQKMFFRFPMGSCY